MAGEQETISPTTSIHPGTHIDLVTLRVADVERSLQFYQGILGFQPIEQTERRVLLGTQDGTGLLELIEVPGAAPQPRQATGLYHVAILMPTRADLRLVLLRLVNAGWQIGQGDHLVSEALYISDPDDNGLEVYCDRPRETWSWKNGLVEMATDPVDMRGLLEEGTRHPHPWNVLPAGTRVGHIHLQVGDIPEAERFYHTILGFDVTAHYPGALFVSAGGYHHHLGLNIWHSRGAKPTPESSAGLKSYVIALPTVEALAQVQARLSSHNITFKRQDTMLSVADPWRNQIKLQVVPAPEVL